MFRRESLSFSMDEKPKGCFVTRAQGVFIAVLFVVVCVSIGLLAGLLKAPCPEVPPAPTNPPQTTAAPPYGQPWLNYRLPSYLVPFHYDLTMRPDFYGTNGVFYGNVSVHINITQETPYLLIHYKLMNIASTKVIDLLTGRDIQIKRTFPYLPHEFWVVELEQALNSSSRVILHLSFDGSLTNGIVGFYKSTYVDIRNGETRSLATTKFQPTHARKAFPCLDEPALKATFNITLRHRTGYHGLSNMPIQSNITAADGLVDTRFDKSVPMSTYLVCFIVSDFDYRETKTKRGIPVRVFARPDMIDQVEYSLRVGANVTDFYEEYFGMNYHLPKLDFAAIPDYPSGATEHWGIITYRENRLLLDEAKGNVMAQQGVIGIIAHEMVHMWFGNIVTCHWWDDLWLNEGFASYYSDHGVDAVHKDWNYLDTFVSRRTHGVMGTDGSLSSHPIITRVNSPDEINQAFDSIVYSKGSSVIRMIEAVLGEETMRKGMKLYLEQNEYGTGTTERMWSALQTYAGDFDVKKHFDSWFYQMGLPMVTVTKSGSGEIDIAAQQTRYLNNMDGKYNISESPFGYKWYVPLSYFTGVAGENGTEWLDLGDKSFKIATKDTNTLLKFNTDQTGFYRTNYDTDMWRRLSADLINSTQSFSQSDRAGLMNDAFNLASSKQLSYNIALTMTNYISGESEYGPWRSVLGALQGIGRRLRLRPDYGLWMRYMQRISHAEMERLGWSDTGKFMDKLQRNQIIALACGHGDTSCLGNASIIFNDWMNNQSIASNTIQQAMVYGVQEGGEREWNYVWDKYVTTTVAADRDMYLYALAQTRKMWILEKYLQYAMDETKVKSQDFFTVIRYISSHSLGNKVAWDWVRRSYDLLLKRFSISDRYFGRLVPDIVSSFNTEYQLQQAEDFYKKYPDAGAGERPRAQSLETMRDNIAWMTQNEATIVAWLKANVN